MPRKRHIISNSLPYHVSIRTQNKERFGIPLDEMWDYFQEQLYFLHYGFCFRIHSFVMMSNHFHLLVSTPESNLSEAMNYFLRESSRWIGSQTGRINHLYGGRYWRSLLTNEQHFRNVYKYVYRNPVKAKLCNRAEDYPYSTLHGLVGSSHLLIPVEPDEILFAGAELDELSLKWINTPIDPDHHLLIKNGLRNREFSMPVKRRTRRPHELNFMDI